jgi:hypothetical protein
VFGFWSDFAELDECFHFFPAIQGFQSFLFDLVVTLNTSTESQASYARNYAWTLYFPSETSKHT